MQLFKLVLSGGVMLPVGEHVKAVALGDIWDLKFFLISLCQLIEYIQE
jgi:hypothetical protein